MLNALKNIYIYINALFFSLLSNIPLYKHTTVCIYSPVDRHWEYFQFGAVMNRFINILVHSLLGLYGFNCLKYLFTSGASESWNMPMFNFNRNS